MGRTRRHTVMESFAGGSDSHLPFVVVCAVPTNASYQCFFCFFPSLVHPTRSSCTSPTSSSTAIYSVTNCKIPDVMLSKKGKSGGSQVVVRYSQVVVRYTLTA